MMADVVALRSWCFPFIIEAHSFQGNLHFAFLLLIIVPLLHQFSYPPARSSVHSIQFIAEMCTMPAIVALIRRIRPLKVCLRDQTKGGRPSAAGRCRMAEQNEKKSVMVLW